MASEVGPSVSLLAQVKTVDEAGMVCDLYDDENGLDFHDVRLRPVLDNKKSVTLIPKIGSWALAVRIEDSDDWMIVSCGEVEKVLYTCDNVIFNEGLNGGLVNWPEVKAELDKTNELISSLVGVINGSIIPEPGSGSASALQAALKSALIGKVLGNYDGKEDTKILH